MLGIPESQRLEFAPDVTAHIGTKKKCPHCGENKPLTRFYKNKSKQDGYSDFCSGCDSKFQKKWYEKNRGKKIEYDKEWRSQNQEKVKRYEKEWSGQNRDKRRKNNKKWREKNQGQTARNSAKKCKEKWVAKFKLEHGEYPNCQVCRKILGYFTGDNNTSVYWDHRNGGNELIRNGPSDWLKKHVPSPKNIKLWDSCKFGILCSLCNKFLPTKDRGLWLKQITQYINEG